MTWFGGESQNRTQRPLIPAGLTQDSPNLSAVSSQFHTKPLAGIPWGAAGTSRRGVVTGSAQSSRTSARVGSGPLPSQARPERGTEFYKVVAESGQVRAGFSNQRQTGLRTARWSPAERVTTVPPKGCSPLPPPSSSE